MLDWQDCKALFAEAVAFDGDMVVAATSGTATSTVATAQNGVPAIGTIFDARAQFLLRLFTSYTKYFMTAKPAGVYLAAGDIQPDLSDITTPKCDVSMCYVARMWMTNSVMNRVDSLGSLNFRTDPTTIVNGAPMSWMRTSRPDVVQFDLPSDGTQTGVWAEGFYRHPVILYETAALALAVASVAITGATVASPINVHAVAHGLSTGQQAVIAGVLGMTEANGTWTITKVDADHFTLNGSVGANAWTSGGTVTRPASAGQCQLSEDDIFTFAKFASVNIKEGVVTQEGSLSRLEKFDKDAATQMKRLNARALRVLLEGGY